MRVTVEEAEKPLSGGAARFFSHVSRSALAALIRKPESESPMRSKWIAEG
jgi:hypothetical protein